MARDYRSRFNRREFLKRSAVTAAAVTAGLAVKPVFASGKKHSPGKKVIVLGIDGMDPRLSERLMNAGLMPNFAKLRKMGGYKLLGTSTPPQSPVAWANFTTGAGPGTHGIFDFVHRDPEKQDGPVNSMSYVKPGKGSIGLGNYRLQLNFWPFSHTSSRIVLGRKGVPFWDYLDEAGIFSHIYFMPANYPPSPSKYGHHFSLSGLGTPDITGTIGTFQHFAEGDVKETKDEFCGKRSGLVFKNDTAEAILYGPPQTFLKSHEPAVISFLVHRDRQAKSVVVQIQEHRILLKEGQWSDWVELNFKIKMPSLIPDKNISGICRFYLQQVEPTLRLYVSPININPADPVMEICQPGNFSKRISEELGLFYTVGFQEDYNARVQDVFNDEEYAEQSNLVLQQRLELLEYALEHYKGGVLFFYFSSTDLQSHVFWWDLWDSSEEHPFRSRTEAIKYNNHIKELYKKMDSVLGDILNRHGNDATIFALSDHGFGNYRKSFNVNAWLVENGYLPFCTNVYPLKKQMQNTDSRIHILIDWSRTRAYALGMNGLYINLQGRERYGIVKPSEREQLLEELVRKLEVVRDVDGRPVIRKVYRSDQIYSGPQTKLAPDLIIGYHRGYRCDGRTVKGELGKDSLFDNKEAWTADHCFDPHEVPGVLFCNRPILARSPSLIDLAPTILAEFGLSRPATMEGKSIFAT